jgi:hypothetical protein
MVEFPCPPRKKGFEGRKKINHVKGGYKGRKKPFQNYHNSSSSPQIANINFNPSFPTRKPKPQIKNKKV